MGPLWLRHAQVAELAVESLRFPHPALMTCYATTQLHQRNFTGKGVFFFIPREFGTTFGVPTS